MIATNPLKLAAVVTSMGQAMAENVSYYLGYDESSRLILSFIVCFQIRNRSRMRVSQLFFTTMMMVQDKYQSPKSVTMRKMKVWTIVAGTNSMIFQIPSLTVLATTSMRVVRKYQVASPIFSLGAIPRLLDRAIMGGGIVILICMSLWVHLQSQEGLWMISKFLGVKSGIGGLVEINMKPYEGPRMAYNIRYRLFLNSICLDILA